MKKTNIIISVLLILVIALVTAIYLKNSSEPVKQQVETIPSAPPEPIKKPIVHYPVPEVSTQPPNVEKSAEESAAEPSVPLPEKLPEVEESDQSIQEALAGLFDAGNRVKLLIMENFIQKLVATIDNLPGKQLPRAHLPIKPPGGKFIISGTAEAPQTSSRNNKRYAPYVTLLESLDNDTVLKIYVHFYPLFQTAYEQLGYKNAYFNDRLVYVIDHLLETPNLPDPLSLAQPGVLYTFSDPLLEKRSAGQKTLLRIGQENRSRVLLVLELFREKLTNLEIEKKPGL